MNRRKAREKAVQALFQIDVGGAEKEEAIAAITDPNQPADPFLEQLVNETERHEAAIDRTISRHLINWTFDRIGNIDKAILRLAVCEMLFIDDVPNSVAMNEAIELSKRFGDENTRKFVNGILSNISKETK